MGKRLSDMRQRWQSVYRRTSIQMILSASFTAVAVLGMLFMGLTLFLRFSSSTNAQQSAASQRVLSQVNVSLDGYLRTMMRVSDAVYYQVIKDTDLAVRIIDRQIEERRIDIKGAPIIVAGGYGMGSKENFRLVHELADVLGAEVGASRAAVDAGFTEHARQVGQTGVTVRPKLYIACGISGQIQHTAGMDQSSMIISINTDPDAPIARIADYAITGDVNEVIPKMIKYYKQNSK